MERERWDSYYYSGSGTQSGASHVRYQYQQDSCQEGETPESEGYTSVYTSATFFFFFFFFFKCNRTIGSIGA